MLPCSRNPGKSQGYSLTSVFAGVCVSVCVIHDGRGSIITSQHVSALADTNVGPPDTRHVLWRATGWKRLPEGLRNTPKHLFPKS